MTPSFNYVSVMRRYTTAMLPLVDVANHSFAPSAEVRPARATLPAHPSSLPLATARPDQNP